VDVTHLALTLAEEVVYGVACVVLSCLPEIAHPKKFLSLSRSSITTSMEMPFWFCCRVRTVTPHRLLHNSIHQPHAVVNRD
jgi:hypothetical protein